MRVILHQMTLYIEKKIHHQYQSEHRMNHLIKLPDDIERALKSREVTLTVFVDFSEAFDTIDFHILIRKFYSLHFLKNCS